MPVCSGATQGGPGDVRLHSDPPLDRLRLYLTNALDPFDEPHVLDLFGAPDPDTLRRRWRRLIAAEPGAKRRLLKETRDRTIDNRVSPIPGFRQALDQPAALQLLAHLVIWRA